MRQAVPEADESKGRGRRDLDRVPDGHTGHCRAVEEVPCSGQRIAFVIKSAGAFQREVKEVLCIKAERHGTTRIGDGVIMENTGRHRR